MGVQITSTEELKPKGSKDSDGQRSKVDPPRRLVVWAVAAVVTLALQACILASTKSCPSHPDAFSASDIVLKDPVQWLVVSFPAAWCTVALLALLVDHRGRYSPEAKLHRYTWYSALFFVINELLWHVSPLLVVICPSGIEVGKSGTHFDTNLRLGMNLANIGMIVFLFLMTREKLTLLEQDVAVRRLSFILKLLCGMIVCTVIPFLVFRVLGNRTVWLLINMVSLLGWIVLGAWYYTTAVRAMFRAVREVEQELRDGKVEGDLEATRESIRWTRKTAYLVAAQGFSSLLFLFSIPTSGNTFDYSSNPYAAFAKLADVVVNSLAAAFLSGMIGPKVELKAGVDARLAATGAQVVAARERRILEKLAAARSSAASAIAGIMGDKEPEALLSTARERFRAISWDVLETNWDVLFGGPLDGATVSTKLLELSTPCEFGECDAFLSHSWHDNLELKWKQLSAWAGAFRSKRGRSPKLWVDKVCIDQSNVVVDLECLPIFLGGCNQFLVMSGHTYTSRLWCVMELYAYAAMHEGGDMYQAGYELPAVEPLADDDATRAAIWRTWKAFDAGSCNCFAQADKERMMKVIEDSTGMDTFNLQVLALVEKLLASQPGKAA